MKVLVGEHDLVNRQKVGEEEKGRCTEEEETTERGDG